MKIALLMVGIILLVAIIFIVIRSVVMKLISMGILVLALVLVVSLGATKFNGLITPIAISSEEISLYVEGEPKEFLLEQVQRVDIKELEGWKVEITFSVGGFIIPMTMNSLIYEWGVQNVLYKTFGNKIYDHRSW